MRTLITMEFDDWLVLVDSRRSLRCGAKRRSITFNYELAVINFERNFMARFILISDGFSTCSVQICSDFTKNFSWKTCLLSKSSLLLNMVIRIFVFFHCVSVILPLFLNKFVKYLLIIFLEIEANLNSLSLWPSLDVQKIAGWKMRLSIDFKSPSRRLLKNVNRQTSVIFHQILRDTKPSRGKKL